MIFQCLFTVGLSYINGWNHYTMKFVGLWPEERKWNKPSSYLALIPILMMLCFVCVPQTVNLLLVWGDLYLVIENLSLGNITISISVLKAIAFWIHGKRKYTAIQFITSPYYKTLIKFIFLSILLTHKLFNGCN